MILRQSDRALADRLARAEIRDGAQLDCPAVTEIGECGDCGRTAAIHPDSYDQRGESICMDCAQNGAFDE